MSLVKPLYFLNREKVWLNVLLSSIVILSATGSFAQQPQAQVLYFENRVAAALATLKDIGHRQHYLGEEVGRKYAVFHYMYVYTVSGQFYQTGQQVIVDKPVIFNAVRRSNHYYRTLLRRNKITADEARAKVNHLLDVAISLYSQPSEALENKLRGRKNQEEIARIFEMVVLR